jgi:uncharacterized protein (TIGR02266 family)
LVDPNTRQGKRTPVTLKIKFKSETLEQFIERYAVDVSQGGIFIRTKEPLAVGTQMKFEFQLRDASPLIAGEGTVVWTRENDPSRPAIAPGMGVRFDRLADGSQGILERILAEKAKQAPQRPAPDTTKPPLFTDTPTRVAPAPMQEALLGKDNGQRKADAPHNDSHTPLPKPIPFHSDADEFPDEAFEEATKVRALDELIAQTAEGGGQDDLAVRRGGNGRAETRPESVSERAETRPMGDDSDAPGLPTPPELARQQPRMLDTSPSPRVDPPMHGESMAKTRLGVEPARARVSTGQPAGPSSGPLGPFGQPPGHALAGLGEPLGPTIGKPILEAPPLPSGMRAVAAEQTEPARLPPARPRSNAPLVILLLLLVAAGGAAVWFLVLRPRQTEQQELSGPGKTDPATGSGTLATGPGTGSGVPGSTAPAETVTTVISASVEGATVEIPGSGQSGPAPFTAKLDRGKPYKVRVAARGFATSEIELKGGDDNRTVTLVAKPRVLSVDSDPSGAVILVDSGATGHTTPFDIELTAAQAAKKTIRLQLRKTGYRALDRTIDLAKLTEEDTRMILKLSEKLAYVPRVTGTGSGSAKGSAHDGTEPGVGSGSDATTPVHDPSNPGGSAASPGPVTSPSGASGSAGSAAEPEPEFTKPQQP